MSFTSRTRKMSRTKKVLLGVAIVLLGLGSYGAYYVQMTLVDYNTIRPCELQSHDNPNEDSVKILLPCYETAAKNSPGSQEFQYRFAGALASLGRYDEARPIFEKLSHSYGSYTTDSRKMLLPGSMQYIKEMNDRLQRNWHTRQALGLTNGVEEREFLRLHAVVRGGRITRMSAAHMAIWQEMRERHQKAMDASNGYGQK